MIFDIFPKRLIHLINLFSFDRKILHPLIYTTVIYWSSYGCISFREESHISISIARITFSKNRKPIAFGYYLIHNLNAKEMKVLSYWRLIYESRHKSIWKEIILIFTCPLVLFLGTFFSYSYVSIAGKNQ